MKIKKKVAKIINILISIINRGWEHTLRSKWLIQSLQLQKKESITNQPAIKVVCSSWLVKYINLLKENNIYIY